ncbi:hypothetical protein GCM10008020_39410 [Massilia psychrophila]|uniref:nucleotide-binding protein n=1 Tax=Massilia psychrophila TaxID=1603353 RepID=UPI001982BD71|nr:hypothetical protein [Massilia psychrophila]GGE90511.1 hypothetical protein GCM10008020_39410 [Massilia psychrophila]
MSKVHIILQGKGGVGKSVVAALLSQYLASKGSPPANIDTDPVNASFSGYKGLAVHHLKIMEDDEINPRSFDTLVEMIAAARGDVIIDNGASSFVPLSHFLISNQVPALLAEMDRQLVVHTVITGSQALLDTVSGFAQLASQFPGEALFVVWLNPYWGPIEHEGKGFEQMKAYQANKARVAAIVRLGPGRHAQGSPDVRRSNRTRYADHHDQAAAQDHQKPGIRATRQCNGDLMDPFDDLIREIGAKHGIAVGRDDPILVLQTINLRLMHDSAKAQQVQLDQYKEELEGLSQRWGNDARDKAERILNASLAASKDAMQKVMEEGARRAAAALVGEVNALLGAAAARAGDARKLAWLNVFASCVTLCAAAIVLWSVVR